MTRLLLCLAVVSALASASAEPVTSDRINSLPTSEQAAWKFYCERSQANARTDATALQAEISTHKMTNALRAPSGGDFRLPVQAGDTGYASLEASNLAHTVLSYQTPCGGWSKHTGYARGPRQPGMQWTSQSEPGRKPHYLATFDNGATTTELRFLANVWHATKREDCKAGFIKGLNYILAAQYPNGGWPQVYPLEGGYHDDITFNDDAMTHILELLQAIKNAEPCYAFLDASLRQKADDALAAGIRCVLKLQVVQDGEKTVWCGQHDALTLQPTAARKMEPATLSGLESAGILKFLMSATNPSPDVVASIESGLAWLDRVKITGLSRTNLNGRTTFLSNSNATQVYWARFYNLTNSQPVFPGRDGVVYDSFAALAEKNPLGYDYLSTQPGSLLNTGQKKWRKMLAGPAAK